jgi:iron complex outermembrane receptor protein
MAVTAFGPANLSRRNLLNGKEQTSGEEITMAKWTALWLGGAAFGVLALTGEASAQSQPTDEPIGSQETPATAESADSPQSNDIIVTAQRRRERLEDVPASVAVVSGESLTNSGVSRFQDLGNVVPGVQIARTGTNVLPSIRGISSGVVGIGQENNVAIYIDGFYQPDAFSINQDFANLADVQVLKGPQGTLYGRNATGGAILVNTLDPAKTFEARGTISYGSRNDLRGQAYITGPITENLAFGLAAYSRSNDGYIHDLNGFGSQALLANPTLYESDDNRTAPYRNRSIRAKLKWTPPGGVSVTLGYSHFFIDDPRAIAYTLVGRSSLVAATAKFTGLPISYERDTSSLNFRPEHETRGDDFTLAVGVKLGGFGEVTSRTSYLTRANHQKYDFDGTPFDANSNDVYSTRRAFTQAIDASITASSSLNLLVGAFYYNEKSELQPQLAFSRSTTTGATGLPIVQIASLKTEALAGYADGTLSLTSRLSLTAGVRYSTEKKTVTRENPVGRDLIAAAGLLSTTRFDGVTARFIARYRVSDHGNIYASFSQGFKSGTYATSGTASLVKPETINAYEIGYKQGGPIRFEAAAFYYDYKDLQTGATIFVNGLSGQVLFNVPKATVYGAETNISISPIPGLNLRVGAAYTRARYDQFPNATGTGISAVTGLNITQTQDWTGLRLIRSPDWTAVASADYTFDFAGGHAGIGATVNYTSEYTPSSDAIFPLGTQNLRYLQTGFAMVNLQANWTEPSGKISVGVFVENAANKRYKIVSNGSSFGDYDIYNEPRSVGVRFSFRN